MTKYTASQLRDLSDPILVVAIARWQPEALQEVYRRHAGVVHALASRILNDRTRAEDVAQEVFLNLWNEPDKFDAERGSLRTFLLTRTHSRSVDMIRSEESRRRREDTAVNEIDMIVDDLERQVVDIAMAEHVQAAFNDLPEPERNAIQLTYFQGHTYREAARLLNEPEGTIKSRIRAALKRLHQMLPTVVEEV